MAEQFQFDGRRITQAGAYSSLRGAVPPQPFPFDTGSVLIVDIPENTSFGTTPVLIPDIVQNGGQPYLIQSLPEAQRVLGYGQWGLLVQNLFNPGNNVPGVSQIEYVKVPRVGGAFARTLSATINVRGGDLIIQGKLIQGTPTVPVTGTRKYNGLVAALLKNPQNTTYRLAIGRYASAGVFGSGNDLVNPQEAPNGRLGDLTYTGNGPIEEIYSSPFFANIAELLAFLPNDPAFSNDFVVAPLNPDNRQLPIASATADFVDSVALASRTYSTTAIAEALEHVRESHASFCLLLHKGTGATSNTLGTTANEAGNITIANFPFKHKKIFYISTDFNRALNQSTIGANQRALVTQSIEREDIALVYGGFYQNVYGRSLLVPPENKAALLLGREAGLAPENPLTLKRVNILQDEVSLSYDLRDLLIDQGILHTYFNPDLQATVVNNGINTLKGNRARMEINPDGTSYVKQIMRMVYVLNRDISINAFLALLTGEEGPNANTVSDNDLVNFTTAYLQSEVNAGGMVLDFNTVAIQRRGQSRFVTYNVAFNGEVNKLFFTGYVFSNDN